jgi:Mg2+/Co2+ transporter CorC
LTISTTIIKSSSNGSGSTSAFTYSFKITDDDDIQVIIRSATGVETVKTLGTHYNVSGVGNNSGTVTFTSGNIPASGETVVIKKIYSSNSSNGSNR